MPLLFIFLSLHRYLRVPGNRSSLHWYLWYGKSNVKQFPLEKMKHWFSFWFIGTLTNWTIKAIGTIGESYIKNMLRFIPECDSGWATIVSLSILDLSTKQKNWGQKFKLMLSNEIIWKSVSLFVTKKVSVPLFSSSKVSFGSSVFPLDSWPPTK